jgi:hypothetical protein
MDIWLTRLLYLNGLALWATILFYESCLSITIGLMYSGLFSPSVASFIGSVLFFVVFYMICIAHPFQLMSEMNFIILHLLAFVWLTIDTCITSYYPRSLSPAVLGFMIPFFIFNVIRRLLLCRVYFKQNRLSALDSGRVYSLVVPPRNF